MSKEIADRIEWLMENHRPPLTARELSRRIAIDPQKNSNTIGGLLHSLRTKPASAPRISGKTLDALHSVLGCSADWILWNKGEPYINKTFSSVDPAFPNRGAAINMARLAGLLEEAILAVSKKSPDRDLHPMDWYKLIENYHQKRINGGGTLDSFEWSTDQSLKIVKTAATGLLAGIGLDQKWWDCCTSKEMAELKQAMMEFRRFEGVQLRLSSAPAAPAFELRGWPIFDEAGRFECFRGIANILISERGAHDNSRP